MPRPIVIFGQESIIRHVLASPGNSQFEDTVPTPSTRSPKDAPLDWTVILFVTLSPLVSAAGAAWWIASGHFHAATLWLALGFATATGLAVTAGYHRMFAHRAFEAPWITRLALLLTASAGFQNSALVWAIGHRKHHRYLDGPGDPYGINHGFWYAHFLWMFRQVQWQKGDPVPPDLLADPLVRFQHRFYAPLSGIFGLALPTAIASLWGDPWGGFFVAGLARIVINHHLTFAINSVCHTFGSQPYSSKHTGRDHWFTATLTYGEGYHNFHHEFPGDYRNGHKPWHWDPTKWLVYTLGRARLASNLRMVSDAMIEGRRARQTARRSGTSQVDTAVHTSTAPQAPTAARANSASQGHAARAVNATSRA